MNFISQTFVSVLELCLFMSFHDNTEAIESVFITFENKCPFTVNVNWHSGKTTTKYLSLKHGESKSQHTYVSHMWSATDGITGVKQLLDGVPLFTVRHKHAYKTVGIKKAVTEIKIQTRKSRNHVILSDHGHGISFHHKFVEFSVQACGHVQIALMTENHDVLYEIIIGEGDNTSAGIAHQKVQSLHVKYTMYNTTGPLVQCTQCSSFHITWNKKNITIGRGKLEYPKGKDIFNFLTIDLKNIANVGVVTPESEGNWIFNVQSDRWDEWEQDGTCSLTCGNGTQRYIRQCSGPAPGTSVSNCIGNNEEYRPCAQTPCYGNWKPWEAIGPCSVTCGNGMQLYIRSCETSNCKGKNVKVKQCVKRYCTVFKWSYLKGHNLSRSELKQQLKTELDKMTEKLKIDKKNTTTSVRLRTSAKDNRPSAVAVGYFGTALIIVPVLLMASCDVTRCLTCLKSRASKVDPFE